MSQAKVLVPLEETRTRDERADLLVYMRHAKDVFYAAAQRIGHHQFLEFAGLMNEYVIICEATHEAGRDFTTGAPLAMAPHHAQYLAEKLDCIYGNAFARDPELRRVFVEAFLG
jgi:hypothetical protein